MDQAQILAIEETIPYDGSQLRPHWLYDRTGQLGSAIGVFQGPCHVALDHMVDLEDVHRNAPIHSDWMLHFIVELFDTPLHSGVLFQRLMMAHLAARCSEQLTDTHARLLRRGDDLYYHPHPNNAQPLKLSVSIATVSLVSSLIHVGLNITTDNTPLPTAGLWPHILGLSPAEDPATVRHRVADWGVHIAHELADEWASIRRATMKVRPLS